MEIFEVRFSLRTQQHRQRSPQATSSLIARVPSDVLSTWALCIVSDFAETAHSPWIPDQVASGVLPVSSPVCFGSVSNRQESTGDKAALARSVFSGARPLALTTLLCLALLSQSVWSRELLLCIFCYFSPQLGPVDWRDLSHSCERGTTEALETKARAKVRARAKPDIALIAESKGTSD